MYLNYFLFPIFAVSEAPPPVKAGSNKPASTSPRIAFEGEVVLQSSLAFLQNTKEKEEKVSISNYFYVYFPFK